MGIDRDVRLVIQIARNPFDQLFAIVAMGGGVDVLSQVQAAFRSNLMAQGGKILWAGAVDLVEIHRQEPMAGAAQNREDVARFPDHPRRHVTGAGQVLGVVVDECGAAVQSVVVEIVKQVLQERAAAFGDRQTIDRIAPGGQELVSLVVVGRKPVHAGNGVGPAHRPYLLYLFRHRTPCSFSWGRFCPLPTPRYLL